MTTDYLYTSKHIDKNFMIDGERMEVSFFSTNANTTAYQIENTQGAEYGQEAERIRMLFEAAPDLFEAAKYACHKFVTEVGAEPNSLNDSHWYNKLKSALRKAGAFEK